MTAGDLNGDGRDELLVLLDHALQVVTGDLKEIWSRPHEQYQVGFIKIRQAGTTPTLVVHPAMGLDAASGHPRWAGDDRGYPWNIWRVALLDPGDATRLPLLFPWRSREVCYQALPATPEGKYAPPQGTPVQPGLAKNDPRWTRALPWTTWLAGILDLKGFLFVIALALLNVAVPLAVLRLAARRRPWTVRLLMALPVAAAIPLMALLAIEPILAARADPWVASAKLEFALGSIAGIPIVVIAALACRSVLCGRIKALARLIAFTMLTSFIIGAVWLWFDMKSMPAIERYGRTGWYLVLWPGAYTAGLLLSVGWVARSALGLIRRPGGLVRNGGPYMTRSLSL